MWLNGCLLLCLTRTQATIAQSSCEAELVAMNATVCEMKMIQTIMRECELECQLEVNTDSSSALRVASRRGLGRMRHMEIRRLWLQDEVAAGRLVILYTKGEDNVADLLTKNLGGPRHRMLTDVIGMRAAENNVHEK